MAGLAGRVAGVEMSKKVKYWCDSGANIHSRYSDEVTLDELGYTESEWAQLSGYTQAEIMKDYALARLDWGYELVDE